MEYKVYGKNPTKQNISLKGKGRNDPEDDYDEDERFSTKSGIYMRRVSALDMDYHLDSPILAPSCYRDLMQCITHMNKEDVLRIWVETGGGRLDTTLKLIQKIQETEGEVTVIGDGMCASGGAILFLQAPNVVVTKNMRMMLHSSSGGYIGKEGEMQAQYEFDTKFLDAMTQETYHGFLTPQEIEMLKVGRDYYFNSEEIIERLEIRDKVQSEILVEREAALAKESVAKKKTKPRTGKTQ